MPEPPTKYDQFSFEEDISSLSFFDQEDDIAAFSRFATANGPPTVTPTKNGSLTVQTTPKASHPVTSSTSDGFPFQGQQQDARTTLGKDAWRPKLPPLPRIPSSPSSPSLSSPASSSFPGPSSLEVPSPLGPDSGSPLGRPASPSRKSSMTRSNTLPRLPRLPSEDISVSMSEKQRNLLKQEAILTKFKNWIEAFVVVNFDLDIGPVVEATVPPRKWGLGVAENIAFSAFPDTNLFNEGQLTWSFKLQDTPLPPSRSSSPGAPSSPIHSRNSSPALNLSASSRSNLASRLAPSKSDNGSVHSLSAESTTLYGFVFFLQRRDGGNKRGYFQKSLVILTKLPYPSMFTYLVKLIGGEYFTYGQPVLLRTLEEIAAWPPPIPSETLSVLILNKTLEVELPPDHESSHALPLSHSNGVSKSFVQRGFDYPRPKTIFASLPTTTPLSLLAPVLPSIWLIWECLILSEPLIIFTPSPQLCSELIWWLQSFIRPFPPGDFRPYFHIHEKGFDTVVNKNAPSSGVIIGVTNPWFRTTAAHWPHVLTLGEKGFDTSSNRSVPIQGGRASPAPSPRLGQKVEYPDGLKTKRKRHISKDRVLLKRLQDVVSQGATNEWTANKLLVEHMEDLTKKFIEPLEAYFQTLIPDDVPGQPLAPLRPFSTPTFLATLKTPRAPLSLPFRPKSFPSQPPMAVVFYEQFLKSRGFGVWLAARCDEALEDREKREQAAAVNPFRRGSLPVRTRDVGADFSSGAENGGAFSDSRRRSSVPHDIVLNQHPSPRQTQEPSHLEYHVASDSLTDASSRSSADVESSDPETGL